MSSTSNSTEPIGLVGSRLVFVILFSVASAVQDSFQLMALPAILRAAGAPLGLIAALQGASMISLLSLFIAPLIDRHGSRRWGHYRGWLLPLQIVLAVLTLLYLVIAPSANPVGATALIVVSVLVSIVITTQSTALTGLIVRLTTPQERTAITGLQQGAMFVGILVGGGALLALYENAGWLPTAAILAALTFVPLPLIFTFREPVLMASSGPLGQPAVTFRRLLDFVIDPSRRTWILVLLLAALTPASLYGITAPLLVDSNWSLTHLGIAQNVVGALMAGVASVLVGKAFTRLKHGAPIAVAFVLQAVVAAGLLLLLDGQDGTLLGYVLVGAMVSAQAIVMLAVNAGMLDQAHPGSASTDVAIQNTLFGLSGGVGAIGCIALAGVIGYAPLIIACVVLSLVTAAIVLRVMRTPEPEPAETVMPV